MAEGRTVIERWRRDYNDVRPHSALGELTCSARLMHLPNGSYLARGPKDLKRAARTLRHRFLSLTEVFMDLPKKALAVEL